MATHNNPADEPVDFDDLLGLTADDEVTTPVSGSAMDDDDLESLLGEGMDISSTEAVNIVAPDAAAETPDQKRIRELKAALSQPLPKFEKEEEEEDTPEKREIKELEDQLARRQSVVVEKAPTQYAPPVKGESILIHVVMDGFIAMGEVWYRGQELEFEVGGKSYEATKDRNGNTWVDLAGDVQAQYDRWGKQYLAVGPFVGRRDEKFEDAIAAADQRRGRAVPLARI